MKCDQSVSQLQCSQDKTTFKKNTGRRMPLFAQKLSLLGHGTQYPSIQVAGFLEQIGLTWLLRLLTPIHHCGEETKYQ